jgi:predicted ATPase
MIREIMIRNFKCFKALDLPTAGLTLLTGFNASGKSTSIQPLLLLAQTLRQRRNDARIPLLGELVNLGSPGEILHQGAESGITIGIKGESADLSWSLAPEGRSDGFFLSIKSIEAKTREGAVTSSITGPQDINVLLPTPPNNASTELLESLEDLVLISATRTGTPDVFPTPAASSPIWADVGACGEYAPWLFERHMDDEVVVEKHHPQEASPTLRKQLNAWASTLFPGAEANAQRIQNTRLVKLELRSNSTDSWRQPANIGFGISYAFPILVACLLAKKGQIIVIDSPEAHLHPLGQSMMGRFLAKIASAGVQVFIETHSDHLLNGVRLAIKKGSLPAENASVHFFSQVAKSSGSENRIISPLFDKEGNMSEWPEGFFDQAEKDLFDIVSS